MSHLVLQNPFSNALVAGYETPKTRRQGGFSGYSTQFQAAAGSFRDKGPFLPKWLQFKSPKNGGSSRTPTTQSTPKKTKKEVKQAENTKNVESEKAPEKFTRRGSAWSIKSNTIGGDLLKKVQEKRSKWSLEDWEAEREYKEARRQRKLLEKKRNRKLRAIRHLYTPSVLCLVFGTIMILGSTSYGVGKNSILWSFKEQFNVIGPIVTGFGAVLLLVTVGLESCETEKLKAMGVRSETNSLIHPDFLRKPKVVGQASNQSSNSSSTNSSNFHQISKSRKISWKDSAFDDRSSDMSSSAGSSSSFDLIYKEFEKFRSTDSKCVNNVTIQNCADDSSSIGLSHSSNEGDLISTVVQIEETRDQTKAREKVRLSSTQPIRTSAPNSMQFQSYSEA